MRWPRFCARLHRPFQRSGAEYVDHRLILSHGCLMGSVIAVDAGVRSTAKVTTSGCARSRSTSRNSFSSSKRFHCPGVCDDWRSHSFGGHHQRPSVMPFCLDGNKIVNTLRVGFDKDGSWRIFGLRHDFHPARKACRPRNTSRPASWPRPNCPSTAKTCCRASSGAGTREPPVPAAGRRHPSRLRQTGRGRYRNAGNLHFQLRGRSTPTPRGNSSMTRSAFPPSPSRCSA